MAGTICPYCGRGGEKDPEYLDGLTEIVKFTGIPRSTFHRNGYMEKLLHSRFVFARPGGMYGRLRYWSYKRLIMGWMVENFTDYNRKTRRINGTS